MTPNGNGSGPITYRVLAGALATILLSLSTCFAARATDDVKEVRGEVKIEQGINNRQDREIGENFVRLEEQSAQLSRIEAELKDLNAYIREGRRGR